MNAVLYLVCSCIISGLIGALIQYTIHEHKCEKNGTYANFYVRRVRDKDRGDMLEPYMEFLISPEELLKQKPDKIEVRMFYDEQ